MCVTSASSKTLCNHFKKISEKHLRGKGGWGGGWGGDDANQTFFRLALYLVNSPKNQSLEKVKKNSGDVIIYNSVPKIMIICYTVPEIWCVTDVIIFHFGPFFALLPL